MEQQYLQFLMKYMSLPDMEADPSIFEVSGYPHYENVCSNILAFYLHPQKQHGMGPLLLSSIMQLADISWDMNLKTIKVEREFYTKAGGRLDLLVTSDEFAIGIENKIFHHLHNDLLDYQKTIQDISKGKEKCQGIVLSLSPVEISKSSNFINITYADLWKQVRTNIGFYITATNQKWVSYLTDFMISTEMLAGGNMEFNEKDEFFLEHEELMTKLVKDWESFLARINSRVAVLKESLDAEEVIRPNLKKRWIYTSSTLVHDYVVLGNEIAFDLEVSTKGWKLKLFGRNRASSNYLRELMANHNFSFPEENRRLVLERWTLSTGLEDIRQCLTQRLGWFESLTSMSVTA